MARATRLVLRSPPRRAVDEWKPIDPDAMLAWVIYTELRTRIEAYRSLGEHAAEAAFDPLLVQTASRRTSDWLRDLEQRLLPAP